MKKRQLACFAFMVLGFSLAGCTSIDNYVEEEMKAKSGVYEDENYQRYRSYKESGALDQEGYFSDDLDEEEVNHDGEIHVSFAENRNLSITYYTDSDRKNEVNPEECYIKPGDTLYAKVENSEDVVFSTYKFSGFVVYEYNEDGTCDVMNNKSGDIAKTGVVLTVPKDYEGSELSVLPEGEFENLKISLNDYCKNENDEVMELDGKWSFNDSEFITDDTVDINPITPYIISYEYDSDEYFYHTSVPEAYYTDNDQGIVIFKQREASDDTTEYSVELHKYINITLVSDKDRTYSINGGKKENVKANNEVVISKLKYGDIVTIETNKEWADLDTNRSLILTNTEELTNGYKYRFVVPEKGSEFEFNPQDYHYDHGTIVFKCFGSEVKSIQYLAKGSKIYYEEGEADSGYWLVDDNNYIVVSDEESTKKKLNEIHFTRKVQVSVNLEQPKVGGKIIYYVDGEPLSSSKIDTYSGTEITMDFEPWEGWICDYTDGKTYVVAEDKNQTVNVNGFPADNIFKEDEGHKPMLQVVLEKSVGEDMQFRFAASGLSEEDYKYEKGWFRSDYKIISGRKIGTEKSIEIAMKNHAIQTGKAVKISMVKIDNNKNKTEEIYYYDDLTKDIPPIDIYSPKDIATSTTWYQTININIGVVDIKKYEPYTAKENTILSVRKTKTNIALNPGDFVEPDQKVIVTISPKTGYYIVGKGVTNDIYQKTMKYSDYCKDISEIVNNHDAKKIYTVTLDNSDVWAKYSYKLDGDEVSGVVSVREGQNLELTYEITDSNYHLTKAEGGFIFGWGSSTSKAKKSIKIVPELDGTIITKANFGIETAKGE